ncbi:MAG: hypothetical protein ACE5F8_04395, partial [Woeseiaceae bacterium]
MTEERSNPDNDPLVSRLYRESATETVPDAVDNAVLREAGRAASGGAWDRYSKSIQWLRPMAWATTVALSLAIVIEVVDTPYVDGDAAKFGALESQLETPEAEAPRIDANARGGRLERKTEAGPATVADEVSVGRTAKQVDTGIFVNQDPGMLRQAEEQARER